MRRVLKWTGWIVAALVALPVLLVMLVLLSANTGPGRRLIERETASLSGGMVRMSGLSGRFPDALHIDRLEVADTAGVYVTLEDVALDWAPTALLGSTARIDRLAAKRIDFARLPVSANQPAPPSQSSGNFSLPVRVELHQLDVPRLEIGKQVAGTAAVVSVEGAATLDSLSAGQLRLALQRLDSEGHYTLEGALDDQQVRATLKLEEPPNGLIAGLAGLPDLGAIAVDAKLDGALDAIGTHLTVAAGPLRAAAEGTVDYQHQAADLNVTAHAPAMTPRPDVSWQSIALDARIHGPFAQPDAIGTVRLVDLKAAGGAIAALSADVSGNAGTVAVKAEADGLRIPGPQPDLLAAAPLRLDATARLDQPDRPVRFALHHPRIEAEGSATTANAMGADVNLTVPELAPFAAIGGVDLQGHTALALRADQQGEATTVAARGTIGITGGMAPVPALIGPDAKLELAATLRGQDVTLSKLTLDGKTLAVTAAGSMKDKVLGLDWTVGLSDLAAVQSTLTGRLDAKGHVTGTTDDLSLTADLDGNVGGQGYKSGPITAHVEARGLPASPQATITAHGTLLDSPLELALATSRQNGTMSLTIDRADWKSAHAEGALALAPQATIPTGQLSLSMSQLGDLAPLLGRPLGGSVEATLDSDANAAKLAVTGKDINAPGTAAISRLGLNATVDDPTGRRVVDGTLTIDGARSGNYGGAVRATAHGTLDALAITVDATSPDLAGAAARLATRGTLDATAQTLALAALQAEWKQQTLRLLSPARIGFAEGISVDRLRLGLRQAELEVAGRAGSTLDMTARLRLPADLASIISPDYAADGSLAADAHITGTAARPEGTVQVTATGVHLRSGPGHVLPPANLTAKANLNGTSARVDSRLTAGRSHLTVTGTAPLGAAGALDLHSDGLVDLAVLDPLLAADGRRVRGQITLGAAIGGTIAAPRVNGSARLANGDVQDIPLGVHLNNVTALVEAAGDTIRIARLNATAGPGTLGGSGTIGLGGQMPVDLRFTADNARPLSSDLITALIDADLYLRGEIQGALTAGGTLHVRRADIRVPEKLPASVAVLKVREAGAPPPPPVPPAKPLDLALDLTLDAPQQVFIRGRGIDVELGGKIHIRGTAANPQPDGGLKLRRGTLTVVGQTLTFTEGSVTFTGAGIADPAINLVAQKTTSSLVATLTVSGSAKNPKITLSSVPDQPQDEILAHLLFDTSSSKLSPFQLAEIAAALAELSGASSGVGDPLASIRGSLGLDRLSVGSGSNGSPTLEAGSYIAPGVYVGAKQSASGSGSQATVQVDLAKGLKLESTAGAGGSNATGTAGRTDAASVGLTYQFEY